MASLARFTTIITLTIALTACSFVSAPPVVRPDSFAFVQSVRPIAYPTPASTLKNGCTASYLGDQMWLTAAHCLSDVMFIDGVLAVTVKADIENDLGIIRVERIDLSPLPIGLHPQLGDMVFVTGHPFGYDTNFLTHGIISNLVSVVELGNGFRKGFMLFDAACAGGSSGSPVFNAQGQIISVLQIGWGNSFSPVCGGATYDQLIAFLGL